MKEQTRNTEVQINEEEIGKLPEKEFRIMRVKMIKNLENKMEKMQESINKDLEELSDDEIKELEELDLEIIMEANKDDTVSGNEVTENDTENTEEDGQQTITDANGGDITSSTYEKEDVGSTAPLTGVLLDKETGEAVNSEDDDSPY